MGVESIISIVIASMAAIGALYTQIFQRKELRGKTRAEQDAISTKASNEALGIIQGGLGKEVERLSKEVEMVRTELDEVRSELETTILALGAMTAQRDELMRKNEKCHIEIQELRDEATKLRKRVADLENGGLP